MSGLFLGESLSFTRLNEFIAFTFTAQRASAECVRQVKSKVARISNHFFVKKILSCYMLTRNFS